MGKSIGRKEIKKYVGRSWKNIMALVNAENCPVVKIDGRWELRHDLFDQWDRERAVKEIERRKACQ